MTGYRLDELPGLRSAWFVVADSTDLGEQPHAVRLLGDAYVLWRDDETVRATADRCPHREAPLSGGAIAEGCLVCPYHGWTFDGDGRCTHVPSSPDGPIPPAAMVDMLAVVERHGLVWLCPGRPDGDPPAIAQDADPSFRRINAGVETWHASPTRMTDNFCDVAHFPWVHAGTLGADVDPAVAAIDVVDLDDDFTGYRYRVEVDNASGERVTQEMTTGFAAPFTVRSTTRFLSGPDAGSERILLLCSSPVDEETALFTFVVWRNSDDGLGDEEQIAFDRRVGAEDRAMLESIPGHLPLDQRATVSVQSDRLSVAWRRVLARFADSPV